MSSLRTGSFCTGICAPEVAWHSLGWTPQWFSEIEPFACAVQAARFAGVPNLGDMTKVDGAKLRGSIDLLVAGTPCQAFSVAGKRESLADDRGNLTLVFVELVHGIDPAIVVWENVPGVLSTGDNAFGCFLAGLVGEGQPLICRDGSWPNAGMVAGPVRTAAWRVLDAQYVGLAQRRRRVFVVSFRTRDGINPGAVLFEPESLPRHSPPSRETGARVAASLTRGADSGGKGGYAGRRREDDSNIVNALRARQAGADDNDAQGGRLITHSLRGDGFDASEDGTGRGTPIVPVAFDWQSGGDCRMQPREDHANSLQRSQTQAVAFQESQSGCREYAEAGCIRANGPGHDPVGTRVRDGMAVRRLTPRECERLQGFSDGYTLINYRGKPATDGPRYRALGNSMAVPVLKWIGERIEKVMTVVAERTRA